MTVPSDPKVVRALAAASRAGGAICVLAGVLVLVGWALDVGLLKSFYPSLASMKVNTALGFVLVGAALWFDRDGRGARWRRVPSAIVAIIGILTLMEYALQWNLGIDEIFFAEPHRLSTVAPGRMSPATAASFVLVGLSLLMLDLRFGESKQSPAQWLALLAALSSLIALLGYLYGVQALYKVGPFVSVALHTAAAFFVASLAILAARPEDGVMKFVASDSPAGVMSRRLLPSAVLLPAFFGWLRLKGQEAGHYEAEFGLALFASSNIVVFAVLIWWNAGVLFRSDDRRRGAEAAVRESEEDLRITLDSIGDAVIATDNAGRVTRMNPIAEQLTGWTVAEARERPLPEVFHIVNEETHQPVESPVERVLREGIVVGLANHTLLIHRDGREWSVADSGAPIRNSGGAIRGVVLVFRDTTAEARAERALRESAARVRVLGEVSHALASVATDHQRLVDVLVRTAADHIGDGCQMFLVSDDGQSLINAANAHRDAAVESDIRNFLARPPQTLATSQMVSAVVIRSGEPKLIPEIDPDAAVDQTDDAVRPLVARVRIHSAAIVPVRARGVVIGALSLIRTRSGCSYTSDDFTLLQDVADRAGLAIAHARLYRDLDQHVADRTVALEAVNRELEAFSYSVAHDLRAPLRSISGFTVALAEDYGGRLEGEAKVYLDRIVTGTERMSRLIDALLSLARLTRAELRRRRVSLSELARAVLSQLQASEPEREVEVAIEDGVLAEADAQLLRSLLENLLGNAWKFTRGRSPAKIEFGRESGEGEAVYFVRDNGAGFDMRYAEKLFAPFQRLHLAEQFEGTGVGLATVQRIVRRHGGRIWAESIVDQGAIFRFTLSGGPGSTTELRNPLS